MEWEGSLAEEVWGERRSAGDRESLKRTREEFKTKSLA